MLGKANKRSYHPDTLAQKIICSSSKLTDDGLFMDGNYTYCYEIIGTLVEEGSAEWVFGWQICEKPKEEPEQIQEPESMGLAKQICEIDHNLPKGLTSCEAIGLAGFCKECFAKNDGCWKEQEDMKEKPESEQPKPEPQYKVGDCRIEFVKKELYNLLDKI